MTEGRLLSLLLCGLRLRAEMLLAMEREEMVELDQGRSGEGSIAGDLSMWE